MTRTFCDCCDGEIGEDRLKIRYRETPVEVGETTVYVKVYVGTDNSIYAGDVCENCFLEAVAKTLEGGP